MNAGEHERDPVDVRASSCPSLDRLDEAAEQRRADEPGGRGAARAARRRRRGAARCRPASRRAWPRSSGPSAIGSSVAQSLSPRVTVSR